MWSLHKQKTPFVRRVFSAADVVGAFGKRPLIRGPGEIYARSQKLLFHLTGAGKWKKKKKKTDERHVV
uniref:Uncharacterized protein n=1 Tax=Anguilla anguilla TaxID=7936 RepID=A0A0E9RTI5_ANGAN